MSQSSSPEKIEDDKTPNPTSNQILKQHFQPPKRIRPLSLPDVLLRMHHHRPHRLSFSAAALSPRSASSPLSDSDFPDSFDSPRQDYTSLLSDGLLLTIFSQLPISQHLTTSLVCKRWLSLHGRLVQSLKLNVWDFLASGRVFARFPNLTHIDVVRSCICATPNLGIVLTLKSLSVHINSHLAQDGFIGKDDLLPSDKIDQGLELIAEKYPNLRRIAAIGASEDGLSSIADKCLTLQELELHSCGDLSLKGVAGCRNLQVVKLIGTVDGFNNSVVSDIGLTLLAQGCKRLVKLELCGCEGSYDGIKAIGQCCQMLEELTLQDHRMDDGWLAALCFCGNLKTLKLQACKAIDSNPGLDEHLGVCPMLEEVHLERCQLRNRNSTKALFLVCGNVRDIALCNCWGLEDDLFALATICRRVKLLYLERCSLLSTGGLESVVLSWKELQRLIVVSCNNIKDSEVTPELATLFSTLKELKWRPDSRSMLKSNLGGIGVWRKGGKFFTRLKG
ncbi:PREDICTED: F-box protein At5g51370-like [Tarenaya hassleriana]|uniref:F-box protein At5g51370-like n=1 Tax=Tarenaya hassleriana TaxID=28532 RepID=UPI00053C7714|nr:PREDICTED: F-box protein At5g51370-like [Tarenaya hassleriana]